MFEFKNVEEPMEVFALANEGFVVPEKNKLQGKFKEPAKSRIFNPLWVLIAVVVLAIGAWLWSQSNNAESFDLRQPDQLEAVKTPLSKSDRDKRVAVMVFENKTGDEYLKDFGTMISDWITRGLMETGEANVISAANIQTQIAQAGFVAGSNPKLAASTGVDLMLQGRYYLQENDLIIHANIIDIKSGEVIHALEPIKGPKGDMVELLEMLTQEILGFWAVQKKKRFLKNPPKYKAWKKYNEALNLFAKPQFEKIEALLLESYDLDTTFYAPLLKLHPLYNNHRKLARRDSLADFILEKDPPFTEWERLRFESFIAARQRDILKSAQLNEQRYKMDSSDASANYMAGFHYNRANYYRKAIEVLKSLDDRYYNKNGEIDWRSVQFIGGYNQLEEYQKAIAIAKDYSASKMFVHTASGHLITLIRMDSIDACFDQLEEYNKRGVYDQTGKKVEDHHLISRVCRELYLEDRNDELKQAVEKIRIWCSRNQGHEDYNEQMGYAAYNLGEYTEALEWWLKEAPQDIEEWEPSLLGRIGATFVYDGNLQKAHLMLDRLNGLGEEGPILFAKAQILIAMGKNNEAIGALENALGIYPFWGGKKNNVFLKPLFDNPEFIKMVAPKG